MPTIPLEIRRTPIMCANTVTEACNTAMGTILICGGGGQVRRISSGRDRLPSIYLGVDTVLKPWANR